MIHYNKEIHFDKDKTLYFVPFHSVLDSTFLSMSFYLSCAGVYVSVNDFGVLVQLIGIFIHAR